MTHNPSTSPDGVVGFKMMPRPGGRPLRMPPMPDPVLNLVGGPNRDLVFDSAKYAYDRDVTVLLDLIASDGSIYRVQANQVAHEDGSGYSLVFVGHVVGKYRKASDCVSASTISRSSPSLRVPRSARGTRPLPIVQASA